MNNQNNGDEKTKRQDIGPSTEKKLYRPEPEIGIGAGKRELKVDDEPEIPVRTDPQAPPSVPGRETIPPQA